MLKDMRCDAQCAEGGVDGLVGEELLGRNAAFLGGFAVFVAGIGEEQRGEDGVELGFVVIPLEDAALADGQPRMPGGDVRGGGGGKLRCDFFDIAVFGEFNEEGMRFEFLIEAPAEAVEKEEEYGLGFIFFEDALYARGQVGEAALIVTGFDEGGVHVALFWLITNGMNDVNIYNIFISLHCGKF